MKLGILNQKHPEYDANLWDLISLLYKGGFDVDDDIKGELLPITVNENPVLHRERLESTSYINYLGDIIEFFASQLFSKRLTIVPSEEGKVEIDKYEAFTENADGKGNDLKQVLRKTFIDACVTRKALVAVDLPLSMPVANRKEEEEQGLNKPIAFRLDPLQLIDWRKDDEGLFVWAIIARQFEERVTPESARGIQVFQWKIWRMAIPQDENGEALADEPVAVWELFEIEQDPAKKIKLTKDTEVPLVAAGATSFKRIPLVEMQLPEGLWIGNKIGPMALEHFRRRSSLISSENRSLMAIPFIKHGPAIGAPRQAVPSDAQGTAEDPAEAFRQKGWILLGSEDDIGFAEPEGAAYEIVDGQLNRLVDEMFRITHLMAQSVSSTSTGQSRSGMSKMEDRSATEVVLEAFGDMVGELAVRVHDTIAEALGDEVMWQAHGLENFRTTERTVVIDEAVKLSSIQIPSDTFRREYMSDVALRLLGETTPDVEQAIRSDLSKAQLPSLDPSDNPQTSPNNVERDEGEDSPRAVRPPPPN